MIIDKCGVCLKRYNKQENKPFLLMCGHTMCLKCINYYTKALRKETFECSVCWNNTKSCGIMNLSIPLNNEEKINTNNNTDNAQGFFELFIKLLKGSKCSIKVKKEYTIKQVKEIIKKEKNIQEEIVLAFKSPLNDDRTLESYNITKTVTIIQISSIKGGIF